MDRRRVYRWAPAAFLAVLALPLALRADSLSDPSWGGSSYQWVSVDGAQSYLDCWHGLSFCWDCPETRVTIDLGAPTAFDEVTLWAHRQGYTPHYVWLEYGSSGGWLSISFTRLSGIDTSGLIIGSEVPPSSDNDGVNIGGGETVPGRPDQLEAYSIPEPATLLLLFPVLAVMLGLHRNRRRP